MLSLNKKKYGKQFSRLLIIQSNILYREFYDHSGSSLLTILPAKTAVERGALPPQNSRTASHISVLRTIKEFRHRFYCLGFAHYFIQMIKNYLTCFQQKQYQINRYHHFCSLFLLYSRSQWTWCK